MSTETVSKGPNKKLILIFAICGVAFMLYNKFLATPQSAEKTEQQAPKAIDQGNNEINKITAQDKDAALTQFQKKMESYQAKLDKAQTENTRVETDLNNKLRASQQETSNQIRALTEQLTTYQKEQVDTVYKAINQKDKGTNQISDLPGVKVPSGGLNFDGDFSLGPDSAPVSSNVAPVNPYGPNYTVLKPSTPSNLKGKSSAGQGSQTESGLFADMSNPTTNSGGNAGNKSGSTVVASNNASGSGQKNSKADAAAQTVALTSDEAAKKKQREDTYEIPAFSYVEVTTLHGVACPIGANAPGASDQNKIPARPVVLPVHGIFHGPNGVERDLGTIHLMGLCSGRRTSSSSTGRALIRIEQLSYWNANGGAQMVASTGYIVDMRDNEEDVYGKLDKASGRTLALQSAAAAAAAFATTLSSKQFTNSSSLQNGTSTAVSQLTGDASSAAVATGIGAMFQKISERFEAEANSAIDTVLVEPGIRLQFVTDQPISVMKPLEPFDIDPSMYDILI